MRSSIVLVSAFVAAALGQNSTSYTLPAGFNIGLVKDDELNSWCQGQRNVCPEICNSGTKSNTCDPKTLQFQCVCSDGKTPDVTPYIQTVPFYVCQANFAQCINAHPDDADGQKACKEAAHCGSKNASTSSTTSTKSSSATTTLSMTTSTSTEDSSSETSSAAAAAATTSNAAIALGEGYSTGIMAGAMFLAVRMFL